MGFSHSSLSLFGYACAFALGTSACISPNNSSSSNSSRLLSEGGSQYADSLAPLSVPNNVAPANDTGVSKVVAGVQHSCAIRRGALSCWGLNKHGQIGNGESGVTEGQNDPITGSNYLVRVALAPHPIFSSDVTDVAVGYEHTCAIRSGELLCWGSNEYGQLGLAASVAGSARIFTSPMSVLRNVKSVAARGRWTCAVTESGKLMCFGTRLVANGGTTTPILVSSTPKEIAPSVVSVSISANHACAVIRSGADQTLHCFGMNGAGEVGNGMDDGLDVSSPFEVFSDETARVSVSDGRSCAMIGPTMKCFGTTLGDRAIDATAGAWRVASPHPYDSVFWQGIAPGLKMSASGTVLANSGDLYYGSYFHGNGTPRKVAIGALTFDYSENDQNGCLMFRNHAVKCWGSNLFGQLGGGRRTAVDFTMNKAVDVLFPR